MNLWMNSKQVTSFLCYCTAEIDLADARSNRLRAVVQAYRALGGGWK
jgi:hypothetical protein